MRRRFAVASVLALVAMLILPGVAYAAVPQPDTLQIDGVEVYRHVLELNDQLYLTRFTVEYGSSGTNVEYLVPDGTGDYTNIASVQGAAMHWEAVDDPVATPDEATTYVYTTSVNEQKDAYVLTNTSIPSDAIITDVAVYYRFTTSAAASYAYCTPSLRLGGVETLGTQVYKNSITFGTYSETLARPGGGNWAVSDLNDLQVVAGVTIDLVANQVRLTQIYVKVSYVLDIPPIDEAYLVRLMNGGVELGSAVPFPYSTLGYEYGGLGMYFSAADVVSLGLGWGVGTGYTMKLQGNPTLTWEGGSAPSTSVVLLDWYDEGSVSAAQDRLTARMRTLAIQVENTWATVDLIESASGVLVLTSEGEYYFENAVPNLRYMCLDIFSTQVTTAEFEVWGLAGDYHSGGNDVSQTIGINTWMAQTFTASSAYSINGVWVRVNKTGVPGLVTVAVRQMAVGVPSGADLVSGTANGNNFITYADGDWENISFTASQALAIGTPYAIVVRSAANSIGWMDDTDNGYAGGQGCSSANAGVAWTALGTGNQDLPKQFSEQVFSHGAVSVASISKW